MAEPVADGSVVAACQRGERDAFRVLFETYKDRVYSLALYFTGDEALAHDVTQEIFLKLFRRIGDFRGESSFTTWLYRLVANACMDEHRRRRRLVPFDTGEAMKPQGARSSQEESYGRREVAAAVQAAVARLKPKLRLPLLLRYVEGMSYDEIAGVLGCTRGAVATRLNRGHKILAQRLAALRDSVT